MKHLRATIKNKCNQGMTLIELIVVIAIFLIVAGLTIFDYGRFRSNASLQNLADDVALSVRRAQGFAIGVIGVERLNSFSNGYGIHFSTVPRTTDTLLGSNKSFMIFYDIANKGVYDHSDPSLTTCSSATSEAGEECYDLLTITTADIIKGICPGGDDSEANCSGDKTLDVTFNRPDPDAYLYLNGDTSTRLSSVDVEVENVATGNTKFISISRIGQISIK